MSRQQVLWIPQRERSPSSPHSARGEALFEGTRPDRLWTLFRYTLEGSQPPLPFTPIHRTTAFYEDYVHDWKYGSGKIQYFSRVHDLYESGVWVLLEWD